MPRKKNTTIDVKKADKALGSDKVDEIVSKEWKVADLPSEEELKQEVSESPKARNNPNSRKNLIQYRKDKPVEVKEKIVKNLQYKKTRKTLDVKKFFSGVLDNSMVEMLEPFIAVLVSSEEEKLFFGTIKKFLGDFEKEILTASDVDDITNLSLNRILELRLLEVSKDNPKRIVDTAATIERFRKNSEKIKTSLASRRTDRVDTKNKPSFSIVDVAAGIDIDARKEMDELSDRLEKEQKDFLKARSGRHLIDE